MKNYILLLIAAVIMIGCDTQPKEILIASKPGQALVRLDQAELGVTPLTIKIIKDTEIVVSKPGYKPQTIVLSLADDPNQVVTLEKAQMSSLMGFPPTEAQITSNENIDNFQISALDDPIYELDQDLAKNPEFVQSKAILIASKPSEASVRINQVEMGKTPVKVLIKKDSAIEVSKPGYRSYVQILTPTDEPNLIVTLEKNQSVAKSARTPRLKRAKTKQRLNFTKLKQMYRQGKINKLDYKAQVRKLKHQMESELVDVKMLYKKGEINKYNYVRHVNEIKYRYKG